MSEYLHHISITCRNLGASRAFYRKLGFTDESHYSGQDCEIVWLNFRGLRIELFHFPDHLHAPTEALPRDIAQIGMTHFCLRSNDLRGQKSALLRLGIPSGPIQAARIQSFHYFFVHDPDGNPIEFQGCASC